MYPFTRPLSLAAAAMVFTTWAMLAQAPTGVIAGTVSDASGAVIPNATITITNRNTGAIRKETANAAGSFSAPALEAGEYEVRFEAQGFRTMVQNTTVQAGGTFTMNPSMSVGEANQVVNVEAAAAQVDYESHAIAGVVTRNTIQDLPINGRNFLALAALEPGVTVTPGTTNQLNTTFNISILGGLAFGTLITIDGGSVENNIEGGTSINFSQEVIQEFQLSSVNFDLSTGITAVGAINIVTRGGGNDFHGSGYFFFRDHNLAAYPGLKRNPISLHPFFARRNPGFWVGGPVVKNKLFFFANYEYTNQAQSLTVQPDLPSASALIGNFTSPYRSETVSARFDYRISDKHSLFARFSHDGNSGIGQAQGPTLVPQPSAWVSNTNWSDQSIMGLTSSLTSTLVNDFRFQYEYFYNKNVPVSQDFCLSSGAIGCGIPPITSALGSSNFLIGASASTPQHRQQRRFEPRDDMTLQKGTHRIQYGFDFQRMTVPNFWAYCNPMCVSVYSPENIASNAAAQASGAFGFVPSKITGNADILNLPVYNQAASGTAGIGIGGPWTPGPYNTRIEDTFHKIHFYGQDTWKIRSNLTLNYGLGYLYDGNLTLTDIPQPAYLAPIIGANNVGKHDRNNTTQFTPAFGFAWSPGTSGKTVIRGGAGMYYDTAGNLKVHDLAIIGPVGDGRVTVSANLMTNIFPGIVQILNGAAVPLPIGEALPLTTLTNMTLGQYLQIFNQQSPAIIQRFMPAVPTSGPFSTSEIDVAKTGLGLEPVNFPMLRSYQTTIGAQRDLGHNMVLSADWARRQFVHVLFSNVDLNHYQEFVNGVRSPVIPVCTPAQQFVPGQECSTGAITGYVPYGRAIYEGLLMKLQKRMSRNFQFQASYAYQNLNSDVLLNSFPLGGAQPVNLNNYMQGYGPALARHNLNVNGIVELPYGLALTINSAIISRTPVQPFLPSGIDLSGTGATFSAYPLPGSSYACFAVGCSKQRLASEVASFNATYAGTKAPNGTSIPTLVLPPHYQFGDPTFSQDFRLTKTVTLKEKYRFSVFGEVFNAFNIANLNAYSFVLDTLNPNPAKQVYSFGQPTQRSPQTFGSGGPRAIEFGGRFQF